MERASYHHGDLERALRDATLAILSEVGADAFTLREAARRAGVNHRAVYRHFADKRALLAVIAEEGYRLLAIEMRAALAEAPPIPGEARLVAVAYGYLVFARREPARYQVMFGARLNADGRFPALEAAANDPLEVLQEELRAIGEVAPARVRRDAGITLWSTVHGLAALVLAGKVPLADRHVRGYVQTVVGPVARGLVTLLAG